MWFHMFILISLSKTMDWQALSTDEILESLQIGNKYDVNYEIFAEKKIFDINSLIYCFRESK